MIASLAVVIAAASAAAPTLESLLTELRALPGLSAHFREEKTIALLAAPLVSEGRIDFAPPARLARRVEKPSPSLVVVDGATLSFSDGRSAEHLDLDANPIVRLYVDSFLMLLGGDLAALSASWKLALTPTPTGWRLALTPIAPAIAKAIRSMELLGHGAIIERMKLVETTGDETVTTFDHVDTARRFSADELKRLFAPPK